MGTVGNKNPRENYAVSSDSIMSFLADILRISEEMSVKPEVVIEAAKVLEMERANNIRVQAGDYADEHVAGICESLNLIAGAIANHD